MVWNELKKNGSRSPLAGGILRGLLVSVLLLVVTGSALAQEALRPSLYVYGCEFIEGVADATDQPSVVQIRLALASPSGQPLDPDVQVVDVGSGTAIPAETITLERTERLPVRLMIVVDTTLNYPTEALRDVLDTAIIGSGVFGQVEDEIGLVKFDVEALNLGAPETDKGALFNVQRDRLVALREQDEGSAVLYDGILKALDFSTDPTKRRLIVMVFSDSAHTSDETQSSTTIETVIARASAAQASIFTLMYENVAPHIPDLNAARQLANETGGYFWVYGSEPGEDKLPGPFADRMATYFAQAETAVDNEYLLTVPVTALTPDENQVAQVAITLDTGSAEIDLDPVNCNVLFGSHTIAFAPLSAGDLLVELGEALTLNFQVDPPPSQGEALSYKLWFNGAPLAESDDITQAVTLDLDVLRDEGLLDDLKVGDENELIVELYRGEEQLSEATLGGISLQQQLALTCGPADNASCDDLTGTTTLSAALAGGGPTLDGETVEFQLRNAAGQVESLEITRMEGDSVTITVDDIEAVVANFGDEPGDIEALVFIGNSVDDALYISDPVPITLGEVAPVATTEPQVVATPIPDESPAAAAPGPDLVRILGIPLGIAILLIIIDLILLRRIRVARVKRLMRFPDNLELPGTPMKITALRNGQSQMHVLSKRTMNLGRGSSNDINLPDDTNVSREHGVVMWRRGQWLYANRKPETRANIDQKNVKGFSTRPLRDGTQMEVGDYKLVCHYDMDADPDSLMETQF